MKQKIVRNVILITIVISFLTYSYSGPQIGNAQDNNNIVDLSPGYSPTEIDHAIFYGDKSDPSNYSTLISSWSAFGTQSAISSITQAELGNNKAITILGNAELNYTDNEISVLQSFVGQGKGIIFLAGINNFSKIAKQFVDDFFNSSLINFDHEQINGSSLTEEQEFVVTTEFTSPRVPAVTNVTKVVYPEGTTLQINNTAFSELSILTDIYPLMSDPKSGKSLGVAIEFASKGRIIFLGSSKIFSDQVLSEENKTIVVTGQNNALFANNLLKWVGRASGFFLMHDFSVNTTLLSEINRGDKLFTTVRLTDENNLQVSDAVVTLELESALNIEASTFMKQEKDNTGTYSGELSTYYASDDQWLDIQITISKRGYLTQSFMIGRLIIRKDLPDPLLPNLVMITILLGGIIIFATTFSLSWIEIRKNIDQVDLEK